MPEDMRNGLLRCVACIELIDGGGAHHFATAFHVGAGLLATSRKVFDARRLDRVVTHASGELAELPVLGVPRYHLDETVDVALVRVEPSALSALDPGPDPPVGVSSRLVGRRARLIGYDASRFAAEPEPRVLETRFESVVDRHTRGRPFFVLSTPETRGFEGAPVLEERGQLVGLVSPLPPRAIDQETRGHLAMLPVHALLETLSQHAGRGR